MKKRLSAIFLALCLTLTLLPAAALADEGGETAVTISTAEELETFLVDGKQHNGETFYLTADLDLDGAELALSARAFGGTFDGQGHTVSNFTIDRPLFGGHTRVAGTVKNLTVEDVTLSNSDGSQPRLGVVCTNHNGSMENVHVKDCTIISDEPLGVVGGLAAMTQDGSAAEDCSVKGLTVEARGGALAVGGAFGLLMGNENTTVKNVTAEDTTVKGAAKGTNAAKKEAGMTVGALWGMDYLGDSGDLSGNDGEFPDVTGLGAVARIGDTYFAALQDAFDAAVDGDDILLLKDIEVDGSAITSPAAAVNGNGKYFNGGIFNIYGKAVTFDLNGCTITYHGHADFQWKEKTLNSCSYAHGLFMVNDGGGLTIRDSKGTGTVIVYGMASGVYACAPDSVAVVTGGTWINEGCADCGGTNLFLYASHGGELSIIGGTFEQALDGEGNSYLIVEHGGEYKNNVIDYSKTKIEISGGTFVGLDPKEAIAVFQSADNQESWGVTDVVAEGCCVKQSTRADGAAVFTVAAHNKTLVSTDTKLPTYTEKGERTYYCAHCGEFSHTEEIDKLLPVSVTFAVTPNGAQTVVKDSAGNTISVETDGTYALHDGESYTWQTSMAGYVTAQGSFTAAEGLVVTVSLTREVTRDEYEDYAPTYTITVEDVINGAVTASAKRAEQGERITLTVTPDAGYELESLIVLDKKGNKVELTDKGSGKFTFKMPASKVMVEAEFTLTKAPEEPEISVELRDVPTFTDVPAGSVYAAAVAWAAENGITDGMGGGIFGVDFPCTRGQIVTFLWRALGCPEPEGTSWFTDVAPGSYCEKAVSWAVEQGITNGVAVGRFAPEDPCTRAQAVTFLYRAFGSLPISTGGFADVPDGVYYAQAVAWAVENGVTNGIGNGQFGPDAVCTRAQVVTFLYRLLGE